MKQTSSEIYELIRSIDMNEFVDSPYCEGLGEIKIVHTVGGYEGGGDVYIRVFHFVDHDIYFKLSSHYDSWDGVDYNEGDFCEVFPVERMTTYYEKKQ